jgi:NAD(P)-dependent dehydrogenase (short-subunit alcohol dehydrogenase family)
MTESSLEERRVLITGGGTGIGRRLALSFAEAGSTIGIAARREEPLAQTVTEIRDHGGRADFHTVDIRKEDRVDRCVDYFWDVFGGIDVLVNNAGANFPSPAASISPNGWRTIIDINLNGTFLMSRAVGKRMMDDGIEGRIINMSATNGKDGSPLIAHSGASKAGINNLTETLAVEWGPMGIRTNAVLPGPVRTPESDRKLWDDDMVEQMEEDIPLGRFAEPADIAPIVKFLASDAGGFINGALIPCDGGARLRNPYKF